MFTGQASSVWAEHGTCEDSASFFPDCFAEIVDAKTVCRLPNRPSRSTFLKSPFLGESVQEYSVTNPVSPELFSSQNRIIPSFCYRVIYPVSYVAVQQRGGDTNIHSCYESTCFFLLFKKRLFGDHFSYRKGVRKE